MVLTGIMQSGDIIPPPKDAFSYETLRVGEVATSMRKNTPFYVGITLHGGEKKKFSIRGK